MRRCSFIAAVLVLSLAAAGCGRDLDPVDYVNPYAGNISHLLVPTYPTVQLPNSMLRVYPERSDYTSEYLGGLPIIVTNHRERSAFKLSVTTSDNAGPVIPVSFDNEHLTPYSFDVMLEDGNILARYAVSHHSAIYSLEAEGPLKVILYSKEDSEKTLYMQGVDIVNTLVSELKHRSVTYTKCDTAHAWQHPKNTAEIVIDGTATGTLCALHPSTRCKI